MMVGKHALPFGKVTIFRGELLNFGGVRVPWDIWDDFPYSFI